MYLTFKNAGMDLFLSFLEYNQVERKVDFVHRTGVLDFWETVVKMLKVFWDDAFGTNPSILPGVRSRTRHCQTAYL